jgi:Tfp pilus assembly protein PilO
MNTKPSYQEKITLSIVIFLALTFCSVYFFIIPAVNQVEAIKLQIDQQGLQAEKNYSQGQDLKKLAENIKIVEPRLGEIEQIFIKKGDPSVFINSLEAAAEKNKVVETANLGDELPQGQLYSKIPLVLEVRGSANGVLGFISDLETQKKYINLNSLEIDVVGSEPGEKPSEAKTISARISADTFWEN